MKRLMIIATALMTICTLTLRADDDRPITIEQLPQKARQFVQQHFPKEKVAYAKMERDFFETTYAVIFANSNKVEFLKNGEWTDVDCKYSTVPAAIIPQKIAAYVKQHHPNVAVVQIDRDKRDYEIKLANGMELKFDMKFNLIGIDN